MYRVVLVDDERLIIRGLSTVVPWAELGCEVVGTAYDGNDGLELIRRIRPDIVLTDIRMPNMDGLTMLAAIRSEFPEIQMSVLTAYREFDYARQVEELKDAVRQMAARLDAAAKPAEESGEDETVREAGNYLVKAALAYIREHCTEQHLSLGEVAEHVYVSQWHLSKLLNRETGQSFFDLLSGMRISRAKELLADPAIRIHEIAEKTGFSDVAHFSRSFKKTAGCTPGEYRNRQA